MKENVLKVIGKAIEAEANANAKQWPPICTMILHQPKRPKRK